MAVEAKICGITRPEDAVHAMEHGAAYIGVVFAWGPRVVTVDRAREIVRAVPQVPVIGVVSGDASTAHLLSLAEAAGVRGLQLHGASSATTARTLAATGLEVWRVASIATMQTLEAVLGQSHEGADLVLLEPVVSGRGGGRGVALDLPMAREARETLGTLRVGLAGGLTPATVAAAIRFVGPDLVDVSSGVEDAPGIKSPERVAHFLEAVRDAGSAPRPGA